jgi:hypothetical protein
MLSGSVGTVHIPSDPPIETAPVLDTPIRCPESEIMKQLARELHDSVAQILTLSTGALKLTTPIGDVSFAGTRTTMRVAAPPW